MAQLRVEPVAEVPKTATLCHYDELEDSVQHAISTAQQQGRNTVDVDPLPAALLQKRCCDIVKYTEYYRVSRV